LVGTVDKKTREPWITQEMTNKTSEWGNWKKVDNEKWRKSWRRLRNGLKRARQTKKEYLEGMCDDIMEFHRHDVMI
jgi:hypothetical protein